MLKEILTEENFNDMNWHDSSVYSILWQSDDFRLVLDIDYIYEWTQLNDTFQFLVSPVTLTFFNVWDLRIEVEPQGQFEINEIQRDNPARPRNAEHINKEIEWDWIIDLFSGEILFKSIGYCQIKRADPILQSSQHLSSEYRKELFSYLKYLNSESNTLLITK